MRTTTCADCGGLAVVEGTRDSYRVICYHCDPRGPVVKYDSDEAEYKAWQEYGETETEASKALCEALARIRADRHNLYNATRTEGDKP